MSMFAQFSFLSFVSDHDLAPIIIPHNIMNTKYAVRKPHLIGGASLGGAFSMTGGLVSYFLGTSQNGIDKKAILEYNMLVSCGTIAKG